MPAAHVTCSAYLTFVALSRKSGSNGGGGGSGGGPPQKRVLPQVVPTAPLYATIHSQAASRRGARLQARERLKRDPQLAAQVRVVRAGCLNGTTTQGSKAWKVVSTVNQVEGGTVTGRESC